MRCSSYFDIASFIRDVIDCIDSIYYGVSLLLFGILDTLTF